MLRELNMNEMETVSGGSGDGLLPPDGFNGPSWEWDWAMNDPLVMAQIMGGAGYDGGSVGGGGGGGGGGGWGGEGGMAGWNPVGATSEIAGLGSNHRVFTTTEGGQYMDIDRDGIIDGQTVYSSTSGSRGWWVDTDDDGTFETRVTFTH